MSHPLKDGYLFMAIITPESADIAKLLGMGAAEFEIPLRYAMFEEVMRYFSDPHTGNKKILQILGKNPSQDGLETVWHYVRLQNEKAKVIKELDPVNFEDEIADEIKEGALTMANMKRVEEDMARREKKIKESEHSDDSVVQEATMIKNIRSKFNVVKEINQTLEKYA